MPRNCTALSFSQSVDHMVKSAFNVLDLEPDVANAIQACNSVLQVKFLVRIRG